MANAAEKASRRLSRDVNIRTISRESWQDDNEYFIRSIKERPMLELDLERQRIQPGVRCSPQGLKYHAQAIEDLHAWLLERGDWVPLGAADESKPAPDGSVEAWGRDPSNPVAGWYGLRKGYRGRFGMYLPPLLESLGLAELTHDKRNNSVRGIPKA